MKACLVAVALTSMTTIAATGAVATPQDDPHGALVAMPRALEIRFALSALPPDLRADASVYVLDPSSGYVLARNGTNGQSCFVSRTEWKFADYRNDIYDPTCYDATGARLHMRVLFDLMTLAFQTDSTRVATFMVAHDGSNRSYPFVGVSDGHHDLSHHGGNAEKKNKIAKINRFHIAQFAYLLERLKSVKEGDGTLLDNCMVVYGSGIADGNAHTHHDLPVLLAGRGGGTLTPGRHVRFPKDTPMTKDRKSVV